MRIAIIGAGVSGLSAAGPLAAAGHDLVLYDKGRGPGGRLSTRRVEEGRWQFDHGAPWFAAHHADFLAQLHDWAAHGVVARWPDPDGDLWVGVPGMNAMVRHASRGLDVHFGVQITGMVRAGSDWWLHAGGRPYGPFEAVVLALPVEQAAVLAGLHDFPMARSAAAIHSEPCWTGMFAFAAPLSGPDVIEGRAPIKMALRNGAKPGREGETWVVHATPEWTRAHLERDKEEIAPLLLAALSAALGADLPAPVVAMAHRWRFACPSRDQSAPYPAFWNGQIRLGACGDWPAGCGVEAAWLSGRALATRMLEGWRAPV